MLALTPPADAPNDATVWIDVVSPTEAERAQVEAFVGCTLPTLDDLSEIERSSQLVAEPGRVRVACPAVANADTDHPSLSHIGMILTPQRLITVRFANLRGFRMAAEQTHAAERASGIEIFTVLLEAFVDRHADLLERARQQLDDVSRAVFRATPNERKTVARSNEQLRVMLRRQGDIGERLSLIRDSMLGVGRIAAFAPEAGKDWVEPAYASRLKAVGMDVDSLNQFDEHLSGKVQFLLDAIVGFIGIEQNDIFKVLTVFSIVGIFPTLVAGWYGMNFHNMPEYGWAYGYQWGITVIVLSTVLPLIWFKWRGWW